jgi:hypothetical protein
MGEHDELWEAKYVEEETTQIFSDTPPPARSGKATSEWTTPFTVESNLFYSLRHAYARSCAPAIEMGRAASGTFWRGALAHSGTSWP